MAASIYIVLSYELYNSSHTPLAWQEEGTSEVGVN